MNVFKVLILLISGFFPTGNLCAQLVAFESVDGKTGFKNSAGIVVLKPQFSSVEIVKDKSVNSIHGYIVSKDSLYGFYDSKGVEIYPVKYKYLHLDSKNRYLFANLNDLKGIVDFNGNIIVPFEFEQLYGMWGGFCNPVPFLRFEKDGKAGVMNERFEIIVPAEYEHLDDEYLYNKLYDVQCQSGPKTVFFKLGNSSEGKLASGLADSTGKIIVPLEYDDVEPLNIGWHYCENSRYYAWAKKAFYDEKSSIVRKIEALYNAEGKLVIPPAEQEIQLHYAQQDSCGSARKEFALVSDKKGICVIDLLKGSRSDYFEKVVVVDEGFMASKNKKWKLLDLQLNAKLSGMKGVPHVIGSYGLQKIYGYASQSLTEGYEKDIYLPYIIMKDTSRAVKLPINERYSEKKIWNSMIYDRRTGAKIWGGGQTILFSADDQRYFWCMDFVEPDYKEEISDYFAVTIYDDKLNEVRKIKVAYHETIPRTGFYYPAGDNLIKVFSPEGEEQVVDYSGKAVKEK